jgi:hypothetical protein
MINGGDFKQDIVTNNGNTAASMQWSGIVHATTTKLKPHGCAPASRSRGSLDQRSAPITRRSTSKSLPTSDVFFGRATTTASGTNFNSAAAANILWGVHDIIDPADYSFSTSSSQNITVLKAGDYLLSHTTTRSPVPSPMQTPKCRFWSTASQKRERNQNRTS